MKTEFKVRVIGILILLVIPFVNLKAQKIKEDLNNKEIIAAYCDVFDGDFAEVKVDNSVRFLHKSGKIFVDKVSSQDVSGIVTAAKNGAYGALNSSGKIIVPFQYDGMTIKSENNKENPENNYCILVAKLNGKYGVVDTTGKVLVEPLYDDIDTLRPNLIKIKKDGLWGWADIKTGNVLQIPKYNNIWEAHNLYGYMAANGKSGLVSRAGKEITPPLYDHFDFGPGPDLVSVTRSNQIGFQNQAGKIIIPVQYDKINILGNLAVVYKADKCGVLNAAGQEIIPVTQDKIRIINAKGEVLYERITDQPNSIYYILALKNNQMALFNQEGKEILPYQYEGIIGVPYLDLPYLAVRKNGKIGAVNFSGKVILPIEFDGFSSGYHSDFNYLDDHAGKNRKSYLAVSKNKKIGLYSLIDNKLIFPAKYEWIAWKSSETLELKNRDTIWLASKTGKIISAPLRYGASAIVAPDRIVETHYGKNEPHLTVMTDLVGNVLYKNLDWDFNSINLNTMLMPKPEQRDYTRFDSGLLKVRSHAHQNLFIDQYGKNVHFEKYDYVDDFYNNLAIAKKKTSPDHFKIGIIDKNGKEILPVIYDDMVALNDSLLLIRKDTLVGLITKTGVNVLPVIYQNITLPTDFSSNGGYDVMQHNKYGFVNKDGQVVLPIKYDYPFITPDGWIDLTIGGKHGLATADRSVIIPPIYDDLQKNRSAANIFPLLVKQGEWWFYIDEDGKRLPIKSNQKKNLNLPIVIEY